MANCEEDIKWKNDYHEVVTNSKTKEEMIKYHDDNVDSYEEETETARWNGPKQLADSFLALDVPKSVRILEIGPGPGIFGRILHNEGYLHIDALDGAPKMLEKCKSLGTVFSNLFEHIIREDEPLPGGCAEYDVVLLSGTLFPLCVSFKDLRSIVKVVKKGGILGFNVIIEPTAALDENFTEEGIHRNMKEFFEDGSLESIPGYDPKVFKEMFWQKQGEVYLTRVVK